MIPFMIVPALGLLLSGGVVGCDIRPGVGVTQVKWLSDHLPALAGTPGDTLVYVLEGREKGGTAVVVGGTHGDEIAGMMAATVLVESGSAQKGRLIVIPHANASAVSYPDPQSPGPAWIQLTTQSGVRRFKCGSRLTHPESQGKPGEDNEVRDLNRAYPGKPEGNLTQKIAYGLLQLLKQEEASIAIDLHEADPASQLAWTIVANPKNIGVAALAVLNLEDLGIRLTLETSAGNSPGLSHREWGDATRAMSFLIETPNPGQADDPRGRDVVNDKEFPLWKRVGVQLDAVREILNAYNEVAGEETVTLSPLPGLTDLQRYGLGAFLH